MADQKNIPTEVGYYWCRPFRRSTSVIVQLDLVDTDDGYSGEPTIELAICTPSYDWMGLSDIHVWGPKIEPWEPDESLRS